MGVLSKNLKFNNGKLVNFEIIKKNKQQAIEELAEGNDGLKELLSVCIDNDIKTIASCGDRSLNIIFEINKQNRNKLINMMMMLDSLYNVDRKIYNFEIGSFKLMNDLFLSVHILTSFEESIIYFKNMAEVLKYPIIFNSSLKFEMMEALVCRLSNYARDVLVGEQRYKDVRLNNDFALYLNGIYNCGENILNNILSHIEYSFSVYEAKYYDIGNIEELKKLVYLCYQDNNFINIKYNIVTKIKMKILRKRNI